MRTKLGATFVGLALGAAAFAEDSSTSGRGSRSVRVTTEATTVSTVDGWAGSVQWLHRTAAGSVRWAGMRRHEIGDSRWTLASGGLSVRPGARSWVLAAEASIGPGRRGVGEDFTYRTVAAAVTRVSPSGRVAVGVEERWFDVAPTRGHLPGVLLRLQPTPRIGVEAGWARSGGGNLDSELGRLRLDIRGDRWQGLAGAAAGRSASAVVDLPAAHGASRLRQAFVGLGTGFAGGEALVVLDRLELGEGERTTLTVSFELELTGAGDL